MAQPKATFSLDPQTLQRLERTAGRLQKSKSEVVREAIAEYAARAGRLSESERLRLLRAFDQLLPLIPPRPAAEVDAELVLLRATRRQGGRRTATGPRR